MMMTIELGEGANKCGFSDTDIQNYTDNTGDGEVLMRFKLKFIVIILVG